MRCLFTEIKNDHLSPDLVNSNTCQSSERSVPLEPKFGVSLRDMSRAITALMGVDLRLGVSFRFSYGRERFAMDVRACLGCIKRCPCAGVSNNFPLVMLIVHKSIDSEFPSLRSFLPSTYPTKESRIFQSCDKNCFFFKSDVILQSC